MQHDLTDIARGRRLSAVTALELALLQRSDRPAGRFRLLRRFLARLGWR